MQTLNGGERDTAHHRNGQANHLRLRINPSEHVFICGQTGSGKSYLANLFLRGVRADKLILDIKGRFEHEGAVVTDRVGELERLLRKYHSVNYRPALPYDWDDIDEAFRTAYDRGNTTFYNDERGGWPRPWGIDLLPSEANCIMRGRQRNVGLWTGTQRPSRLPIALKSEADHFFVFRLQHGEDRKSIAEYAGDEIRHVMLPKRYFWYAGPNSEAAMYPPIRVVTRKRHARRA
jgi:DNA helicase HerA-like ATPase